MKTDWTNPGEVTSLDQARQRLAAEVTDVESAMALVASGSAARVTLGGLRFGDEVATRFRAEAASLGLRLEPIIGPDDAGCDLIVRRLDD